MKQSLLLLAILPALLDCSLQSEEIDDQEKDKNYEALYILTKEAYLANDWAACVDLGDLALKDYHHYHDTVTECKRSCRTQAAAAVQERQEQGRIPDVEDLAFFEKVTRNTLCLLKCKQKQLGKNRIEQVSPDTEKDFDRKEIYNYLQLCHHQLGNLPAAASAAFTHLVANPDDEIMANTLAVYTKKPGVVKDFIVNHEAEAFASPFLLGTESYRQEDWPAVVSHMEEAVTSYIASEEQCRFRCEKPFDMGWFPDFITSVANHFTYCLRCKQNCVVYMQNVNGELVDDVYPLMYNYLQIAYYKMGKIENACHCVGSYLLFYPDDEDMKRNRDYYLDHESAESSWFEPRLEALSYFQRDEYERDLLDFIDGSFEPKVEEAGGPGRSANDSSAHLGRNKGDHADLHRMKVEL